MKNTKEILTLSDKKIIADIFLNCCSFVEAIKELKLFFTTELTDDHFIYLGFMQGYSQSQIEHQIFIKNISSLKMN